MTAIRFDARPLIDTVARRNELNPPRFDGYSFERDHDADPIHVSVNQVAEYVGVNARTISRWARNGLGVKSADQAATALGYHPLEIWPDFHQGVEQ